MIRKINEKARRALKKSPMLGGALLFVTAGAPDHSEGRFEGLITPVR